MFLLEYLPLFVTVPGSLRSLSSPFSGGFRRLTGRGRLLLDENCHNLFVPKLYWGMGTAFTIHLRSTTLYVRFLGQTCDV
jgi:hypothetical protein